MGVALGMHVAHGPRDLALWDLEDGSVQRCVHVSCRAWLNLGVTALLDQRRQPPNFQLSSDEDEDVGLLQLEDEARLGLDEVWVLVAPGKRLHARSIACHFSGDRSQIL